ncbi:MAG TPA: mersacidin/lichenicidin family type 2 lantibiotic [Blastocatellia bacterium]|jgi:mersacidin/lichenicidin family type 2 lantibiotic|nr:mersacidin/lichenicidin family type 2 lantibiotic [Blastocatellia bacterium]
MSKVNIIRAWKDEEYRLSLTPAESALLPENPAGVIDLSDAQLEVAAGGGSNEQFCTTPCTTSLACPDSCGKRSCVKILHF